MTQKTQSALEGKLIGNVLKLFKEHLNKDVSFNSFERHPTSKTIFNIEYGSINSFTSTHLSKIIKVCKELKVTFVDFHLFRNKDLKLTFYMNNEYKEFGNNALFF